MRRSALTASSMVLVVLLAAGVALGQDWPQWRGPNRDGKSTETGLLKQWPEAGPKLLWAVEDLPKGYSTLCIAEGTIYTTGQQVGAGFVIALDLDGKPKWKTEYAPEFTKSYHYSRTTPTYDQGKLYVMSSMGWAVCLDAKTGRKVWEVDTIGRFAVERNVAAWRAANPDGTKEEEAKIAEKTRSDTNIQWGIAESLLVDGDNVIVTPGGPDASVVALNKNSGETVWTTKGLSEKSAYCSPAAIDHGGRRIIVTMLENSVVGIDARDGKALWKHPYRNKWAVHANTPVHADGIIYDSAGYGGAGFALKLSDDASAVAELWTDKKLDCHHHGLILLDGYVHGSSHDRASGGGNWICLELKTGKEMYDAKGVGKASVVYADGMLYCYAEKGGVVGLVKATPQGHEVVSSFKVQKGSGEHWAHPVVCGGRLYVRHGEALMAYDVKGD